MSSLSVNRKAFHNYEIIKKYEAGIMLLGFEVKAIKSSHISLDGSYIKLYSKIEAIKKNKKRCTIVGAHISPLQKENTPDSYNENRERILLMKEKELVEIEKELKNQGYTLIPLSVYLKNNLIKIEIGLARGKKKYDKREDIKKKEAKREMSRILKGL